jgi:serine/threonine protein kinase/tetratricopeptide (TPR) repeat protein
MNVHEDHLKNRALGLSVAELMSLLQQDQVIQWKGERPLKVEDYLRLFPALQEDIENVLVLIMGEVIQREGQGQGIDDRDYLQRFPHLREQLKLQLEFHRALGQATVGAHGTNLSGSSAISSSHVGKLIADKYVLRECIGEGGMGTVWRAEQLAPVKRQVAVKLIKTGLDTRTVMVRFEAERQALAIMDHPNIAKVLDGGVTPENEPYFVMELVKGVSITQYCDHNKLSIRHRLELLLPVCSAIQHAHQKGIIHRDIKPSNVLVALYDLKPVPKVIDFGIAKAIHAPLTDATLETGIGNVIGTPEYMSPEQASLNNLDIDTRTDVYSLGVLLYEILTGNPPFRSEDYRQAGLLEMLRVIRDEEPPRPSDRLSSSKLLATISVNRNADTKKLVGTLRNELDLIVMKALEKDRTRRYDSAGSMAADLQRYLVGEPIHAHPPSAVYRFRKFVHRNRTLVGISIIALLAILTAIMGIVIGYFHAQEQRDIAQKARDNEAAQLKIAQAEMKKAQKAEEQTMNAYRATTDMTIQELIGSKPALGSKERAYLEKTLRLWEEFANREGTDHRSRNIRAEGQHRIGQFWNKLGNIDKAHVYFQKALELRRSLVDEYPQVPDYQQTLAGVYYDLCYSWRHQGQWENAKRDCLLGRVILQKLLTQYPERQQYQLELSNSHQVMGAIQALTGNGEESVKEMIKAQEYHRELLKRYPLNIEYQGAAADNFNILAGTMLLRHRLPETIAYCQSGRVLLQDLLKQNPDDPDYMSALGENHNCLGLVYMNQKLFDEAAKEFKASLSLLDKVAGLFPTVTDYRKKQVRSRTNLGSIYMLQGKAAAARTVMMATLEIWKSLSEQNPQVTEYQLNLAGTSCNLGHLFNAQGKPNDGVPYLQLAIKTLQPLVQKDPQEVLPRRFLSNSHRELGTAYYRLKRYSEAVTSLDEALRLGEPIAERIVRAHRANALAQAGRMSEAVNEVAILCVLPGPTESTKWAEQQWFDFACVYCAASAIKQDAKKEYLDRAMQLLRQAVDSGYKNIQILRSEAVLEPLRQRDDFQKLLLQLSANNTSK